MRTLLKISDKIVALDVATKQLCDWRKQNEKIVFTNGCFDILHEGHVSYLAQAADEGDRLVIGLNSDSSVKKQGKGDDRPVNKEQARALIIAALSFVDLVVVFEEDTPLDLIKVLNPDVLVKGADYDPNEQDTKSKKYIVGSSEVRETGGSVKVIPLVPGISTTTLLARKNPPQV
jgi:rfaE bifunctional protein nucleotidyltransferase chain/domain